MAPWKKVPPKKPTNMRAIDFNLYVFNQVTKPYNPIIRKKHT